MNARDDRPDPADLPDELAERLSAGLDGELSPAEAAALEAELARDPALRAERDRLAALSAAIRDLPAIRAPASVLARVRAETAPVRGSSARYGSWAALFLVALLGFVWWRLEVTRPLEFEGGSLAREEEAAPAADSLAAGSGLAGDAPAAGAAEVSGAAPTRPGARDDLIDVLRLEPEAGVPAAERPRAAETSAAREGLAGESRERAERAAPSAPGAASGATETKVGADGERAGVDSGVATRPPREPPRLLGGEETAKATGMRAGGAPPPAGADADSAANLVRPESGSAAGGSRDDVPEDGAAALALDTGAIRFRSGPRDLETAAAPADLTLRIAVPEGVSPADLERLAAALAAAVRPPPATGAGAAGDLALERRLGAPVGGGAGTWGDPAAAGEAGADPLPAEASVEVPPDRLIAALRGVRDWRRGLLPRGDDARAPRPEEPAPAGVVGMAPAEEPFLEVTLLEGESFDADLATLEAMLREIIARPRAGARGRGDAGDGEDAAPSGADAPAPLRVRFVVIVERPAEPPR